MTSSHSFRIPSVEQLCKHEGLLFREQFCLWSQDAHNSDLWFLISKAYKGLEREKEENEAIWSVKSIIGSFFLVPWPIIHHSISVGVRWKAEISDNNVCTGLGIMRHADLSKYF